MNIRNAKYNQHGTIDCEIEHPKHGWIPFTANPDDVEKQGRDIYHTLLDQGNIPAYVEPVKTQEQIDAELNQVKERQKKALIRAKMEALLAPELAKIDAAKTKDEILSIKLGGK